ncbi:hypothetical protein CsatB_001336 [Cannabis sativa]
MMIMLHEAKGDEEHPQVPCFFIFGDSLVDNGNNNQLETIIKVNNKPYGIDFPGGIATGRFSNGRNVVDIIGEALGFKTFIPPFASVLNGNAALITRGVNYGSGGSGIRNDTGKIVGTLLNLEAQVNHHLMTVAKIKSMLGINEGEAHLNKCIYFVGMGGSDYLTNYFLPDVQSTSRDYAPQQYARVLIEEYKVQILRLYNNGARKFALNGIGALGCTPFAINSLAKKTGSRNGCTCAEKVNEAVQFFNHELILLVEHFNIHYPKAKFIYLNYFGIGSSDPVLKGFPNTTNFICLLRNYQKFTPKGRRMGRGCVSINYTQNNAFLQHPNVSKSIKTEASKDREKLASIRP